eukprot:Clim_evm74s149 gene=Clim_evmTU74s149
MRHVLDIICTGILWYTVIKPFCQQQREEAAASAEAGLIYVLREVPGQLRQWIGQGDPMGVKLNVFYAEAIGSVLQALVDPVSDLIIKVVPPLVSSACAVVAESHAVSLIVSLITLPVLIQCGWALVLIIFSPVQLATYVVSTVFNGHKHLVVGFLRIARGRKLNPIRQNREDHYTYSQDENAVAIMVLSCLLFLVPTVVIWYSAVGLIPAGSVAIVHRYLRPAVVRLYLSLLSHVAGI